MQKIPDNKMDFSPELINSLGFVEVEKQQEVVKVFSQQQIKFVEKERAKIKIRLFKRLERGS